MMNRKRGHYLGTEIDGRWWKRYRKDGFLVRGNGEYWFDRERFYFLRYLTKEPLVIAFNDIEGFELDRWHAGRWVGRRRAIKFIWLREGLHLSSGFVLTRTETEAKQIIETLSELRKS